MKIIDNKIVLEIKDCGWCNGAGVSAARVTCPKCKGTRRGPRGGRGGCSCLDGSVYSPTLKETCGRCNGTKTEMESLTDPITHEQWQGLTFKVSRDAKGRFGFNESYLGLGYVTCSTDYGTAWGRSDEETLAEVKKDGGYVQACKIAKDDGTVCEYVAILVSPQGYKVKAIFKGDVATDNSQADRQVKAMFDPRGLAAAEMLVKANG